MKKSPEGWPRVTPGIFYEDAKGAIDWLCRVFGFEVRLKVELEGGVIAHSELVFGDGLVMVGSAVTERKTASPRALDGRNTQGIFIYVDDVDAHEKRSRAAGAKITTELRTVDYGADHWVDRTYQAEDLEGHRWWFGQRMSTAEK